VRVGVAAADVDPRRGRRAVKFARFVA
jgi:hypothetical protein